MLHKPPKPIDEAELVRLYTTEHWTQAALGKHFGLERSVISRRLKALGVPPHPRNVFPASAVVKSHERQRELRAQRQAAGVPEPMRPTLDRVRENYGAFALAMHADWTYTHYQQQILAPILEGIAALDPKYRRVIVNAPFRHAKTEFCIETFIPFYLGHHPNHTVILLSYGKRLARKFGREIRDRMRSELYTLLFPHATITATSRASDEFGTVSGGRFYASGFDGTVNGLGANFLAIDDPCKNRMEALSETVQTFHHDLYNSVARTRLEPNAAILVVTSRFTPADFVGWRIQNDGAIDHFTEEPIAA